MSEQKPMSLVDLEATKREKREEMGIAPKKVMKKKRTRRYIQVDRQTRVHAICQWLMGDTYRQVAQNFAFYHQSNGSYDRVTVHPTTVANWVWNARHADELLDALKTLWHAEVPLDHRRTHIMDNALVRMLVDLGEIGHVESEKLPEHMKFSIDPGERHSSVIMDIVIAKNLVKRAEETKEAIGGRIDEAARLEKVEILGDGGQTVHFYQAERRGKIVYTEWGKLGLTQRKRAKVYEEKNIAHAIVKFEDLVEKRRADGYRFVLQKERREQTNT